MIIDKSSHSEDTNWFAHVREPLISKNCGGSRISRGGGEGAPTPEEGTNLLFGIILPKKLHENEKLDYKWKTLVPRQW